MEKRKGFYATLSTGKRTVKYLQAYYYQGGRWYKIETLEKRRKRK